MPYSEDEMNEIKQEINDRLSVYNGNYTVDVHDITKAVQRLKLGKSDGHEGLNSDHIINGPHLLIVLITCF